MRKSMIHALAIIGSVSAVMASTAAWAGIAPPTNVPEPGLFGIVAAGVAGVVLVARASRKSK